MVDINGKKYCNICKAEITGTPHKRELEVYYSDSTGLAAAQTIVHEQCSEHCEMIDRIWEHTMYYGLNINAIVDHLMTAHKANRLTLQRAINDPKVRKKFNNY